MNTRLLLIRDLVLQANIGVFRREQIGNRQRVRINVELAVVDRPIADDKIGEIVRYDFLIDDIRAFVDSGHINLVETLAERVAQICLAPADARDVRVRVEKLDIVPDAAAVGVEIHRKRG